MNETVVLVSLIIGFLAITVFALGALLVVRRRDRDREKVKSIEKSIAELDATLDSALTEINKLGSIVLKEMEEKHKAMMFLYSIVDDKHKEIIESSDSDVVSEKLAQYMEAYNERLESIAASAAAIPPHVVETPPLEEPPEYIPPPPPLKVRKRPNFTNPRHKKVWELREQGQKVPDIAKELGMGQREVKLILDMADRAS